MDMPTRRSVLGAGAVLLSSLAGCAGFAVEQGTETSGSGTVAQNLDLREANVTEVTVEATDEGDYRFGVTLYHDDDGEDGYANWWQVETLNGERLGRRDLRHAHSTQPFTRSDTISVPDGVSCVVVRGHDQLHGYGGQALAVALPAGETSAVRQGSDRRAVDTSDCP